MTQKRAKLAENFIKHPTVYRDGKFGYLEDRKHFRPLGNGAIDLNQGWYNWCLDQETVDMANIYLKLMED